MYFILSKSIYFLVQPVNIIFLMLLASFFLKKAKLKRTFRIASLVLSLLFTNPFIINELMGFWEGSAIEINAIDKQYDVGIVLSGVTNREKQPNDRVHFNKGADRVIHAIQLYKQGIVRKILITGGIGSIVTRNIPEAQSLKKTFILLGVSENDLMVEDQSRNTYENAKNCKFLLEKVFPNGDFLLITSAFHMNRSAACFAKQGITIDEFRTDFYTTDRKFTLDHLIIPCEGALSTWATLLRELTGYVTYKILGYA